MTVRAKRSSRMLGRPISTCPPRTPLRSCLSRAIFMRRDYPHRRSSGTAFTACSRRIQFRSSSPGCRGSPMMATRRRRWAPLAFFAAVWSTTPAPAQSAAAWDGRSELRLIAGARRGEELRAGVELRLAPGWKTYWRYPGDAGVPPRFDFARSTNVKSVTVLWPAPQRMSEEVGQSIGYKDVVIFPLRVAPQDPTRPVTLRLNLDYAVCEKLCVPAAGSAELVLHGAPAHEGALAAAEARGPRPAAARDQAAFAIPAGRRAGERGVGGV